MTDLTAGRLPSPPAAGEPLSDIAASAPSRGDTADATLFAMMRFILAAAGLAIIYIDPNEPTTHEGLVYGAFSVYCVFAAAVLGAMWKSQWRPDQRILCGFDVCFAGLLVLGTHGTNSIFFYVFLFPILVVAFSHGYRDGVVFTLASVVVFLVAGAIDDPPDRRYELGLALIRPVYLLSLGYMIARWGGRQILFKRRLVLLRDVNASSARAKLSALIQSNLRSLLEFHGAQRCVLVVERRGSPAEYVVYASEAGEARTRAPREMNVDSGARLVQFGGGSSVIYSARRLRPGGRVVRVAPHGERESASFAADTEFVTGLLEARYFVAAPYQQSDGTRGRLFVASDRKPYTRGDAHFLVQFNAAVARVVENLGLVDELISSAAEHERAMISRDLHDATLQPYIGLRLALEALLRATDGSNPLRPKIEDLIEMANATVGDLRGYTRDIAAGTGLPGETLGAAIQLQARRQARFYGLKVATELDDASREMRGRFAAQIFYVVVEALANIVKHTSARRAFVEVRSRSDLVCVRIGNEHSAEDLRSDAFVPRSIKSRVDALGGTLDIRRQTAGNYTLVQVTLPKSADR